MINRLHIKKMMDAPTNSFRHTLRCAAMRLAELLPLSPTCHPEGAPATEAEGPRLVGGSPRFGIPPSAKKKTAGAVTTRDEILRSAQDDNKRKENGTPNTYGAQKSGDRSRAWPIILCLVLLFLTVPLHAQDTDWVDEIVRPGDEAELEILDEYLREAAASNPELRTQFNAYLSRLEDAPQVGTLPDPEIMFGYFTNPMGEASLLGRSQVQVRQMFPWFGTLGARRDEQSRLAEAAFERFEEARLELFRDVEETYFRYVALERAVAMTEQNLALLEDLIPLVETRYETARTGQADVLRIEMEEDELATRLENLQDDLRPLQARFNELLDRDRRAPIETPERLPDAPPMLAGEALLEATTEGSNTAAPEDEIIDMILERNPAFRALEAEDEAYRARARVARLEGLPSFGLGVEVMGRDYGAMSMFDEMTESVSIMGSVRIPLFRGRYRAQQEQAAIGRETVALQERQLQRRLEAEVEDHLRRYREASRRIRLYRERLVPQARQTLDLLEADYMGDRAGFDEIIQMQRQLLDYAIALFEAQADQHIARAELEALYAARLDIRPDYEQTAPGR